MPVKKKAPAADLAARYRVLSGGISTPSGPVWHDAVVTGADLGDAGRVQALLDKKSIEVAADESD